MPQMMFDAQMDMTIRSSILPAARSATIMGSGVDLSGYEAVVIVIAVGVWTDGTHTFSLEESEDDATYGLVGAADISGTMPVIDSAVVDRRVYRIGYLGNKRYLRVKSTVTGGAVSGAVYVAMIERFAPRVRPVTQS